MQALKRSKTMTGPQSWPQSRRTLKEAPKARGQERGEALSTGEEQQPSKRVGDWQGLVGWVKTKSMVEVPGSSKGEGASHRSRRQHKVGLNDAVGRELLLLLRQPGPVRGFSVNRGLFKA